MKYIAFYLPQYHRIPENDRWWGDGFTEWTNVKKAKPLFKGHYQPHIPLNDNYYDLDLDFEKTMRSQIKMAKNNGLYGFCFYHYWFEGGKKLLEKPIEKFLNKPDLNINFCLCWANEPWSRSWDGKPTQVLMEQEYGDIKEWMDHFIYLQRFFSDERYIKLNGCPVFVIYRPALIEKLDEMISIFRLLAKESGFPDIYIISQGNTIAELKDKSTNIDAFILYEPGYTQNESSLKFGGFNNSPYLLTNYIVNVIKTRFFRFLKSNNGRLTCTILDYDKYWEKILTRKYDYNCPIIPGAFVDWDNSPRRGLNNSRIFIGSTPDKFEKYMIELTKKAKNEAKSDMIFINAWNEWGEGAHLEPDTKHGYGYLKALKHAGRQ